MFSSTYSGVGAWMLWVPWGVAGVLGIALVLLYMVANDLRDSNSRSKQLLETLKYVIRTQSEGKPSVVADWIGEALKPQIDAVMKMASEARESSAAHSEAVRKLEECQKKYLAVVGFETIAGGRNATEKPKSTFIDRIPNGSKVTFSDWPGRTFEVSDKVGDGSLFAVTMKETTKPKTSKKPVKSPGKKKMKKIAKPVDNRTRSRYITSKTKGNHVIRAD